jgi:hypothetical protein
MQATVLNSVEFLPASKPHVQNLSVEHHPASRGGLRIVRNAGDDLDFEVEAGKPVDTDRSPVRIGRPWEYFALNGHDGFELVFGVSVEGRHIDDIVEGATPCRERRLQIGESQPNLTGKVRFRRAIGTAADLTGNKQQIARADRGRIAVCLVKSMAVCGEASRCVMLWSFQIPPSRACSSAAGTSKMRRNLIYVAYMK